MIKVLVVRVDGTSGDEFRLAAAESLAKLFETHVVGLIINVLPEPIIVETMTSVTDWSESLEHARAQGRQFEERTKERLKSLAPSSEVRRCIFP